MADRADRMAVPTSLLNAVNVERGVCWFYQHSSCRKSRKCPKLHIDSDERRDRDRQRGGAQNSYRVPYLSRFVDALDGQDCLMLRSPVSLAIKTLVASWGGLSPIGDNDGSKHMRIGGHNVVCFPLPNMEQQDFAACEAKVIAGYVQLSPGHGVSSHGSLSLMHH